MVLFQHGTRSFLKYADRRKVASELRVGALLSSSQPHQQLLREAVLLLLTGDMQAPQPPVLPGHKALPSLREQPFRAMALLALCAGNAQEAINDQGAFCAGGRRCGAASAQWRYRAVQPAALAAPHVHHGAPRQSHALEVQPSAILQDLKTALSIACIG